MPFILLLAGLVLLISAAKNTQGELLTLLEKDFTGGGNFFYWIISIIVIGAIGYVKELRSFSTAMLALVIAVLFLANPGFFKQFQTAVHGLKTSQTVVVRDTLNSGVDTDGVQPAPASSGSSGILGSILSLGSMFL